MEAKMTPAQLKRWFDSEEFEQQYHCDAPLGAWLDTQGTHFALWAPTAQQVKLNLYPDGGKSAAECSIAMQKMPHGLWLHEDPSCLNGVYYDYDVTVDGVTVRTQDPYARASGVNGLRGMVVDEALLAMERYLDSAVMGKLKTVTIIHGKGTGALRQAVQAELKRNRYVKSYRLGRYGEGEMGVTVVELR